MPPELSDDDVGKAVVTDAGQRIGNVAEVDENHIYVDLMGSGETEHDEDVDADEIKEITADEVILYEPESR